MSHRRHAGEVGGGRCADVDLVVDQQIRCDTLEQGPHVLERATGQHVAEHDDSETPPLLTRQLVEPRVVAQGEPVGLVDRDADALDPEAHLLQPPPELLSGTERDLVARIAAGRGERQERINVSVCRTTAKEEAQARRESHQAIARRRYTAVPRLRERGIRVQPTEGWLS